MKKYILTIFFFLCGCTTMYFHNGPGSTEEVDKTMVKSDAAFGFVAFGDPVVMNGCARGWGTVSTEKNFIQSFLTVVTADLYDPWVAGFACRKK